MIFCVSKHILKIIATINKKSADLQTVFYNIDGIEILLKELKGLYSEEKLKEVEEVVKNMKSTRGKRDYKHSASSHNKHSEMDIDMIGKF